MVYLDGEPAAELIVEFLPDPERGTEGPRSTATTDEQGQFRLHCDDQRDGAVVGFHRIVIEDARAFPDSRGSQGRQDPDHSPLADSRELPPIDHNTAAPRK